MIKQEGCPQGSALLCVEYVIMDINSIEFYTLAFVVAMALVALLMGRTEKDPPSTYIAQLATTVADEVGEDTVCMEPIDGGRVRISREGLSIGAEETVNLVFTIRDNQCTIIEKKGVRRRGAEPVPVTGEVTVKWLRPGNKYRVRYESQVTSTWALFTLDTASPDPKLGALNI